MQRLLGIRFEPAGKIYHYYAPEQECAVGDAVIVSTKQGLEFGYVAQIDLDLPKKEREILTVIRKADEKDHRVQQRLAQEAELALQECKRIVVEEGLNMKMVRASYTFDARKLLFYFSADGRIDFRQLVRRLASRFRTRIELRQIGPRDATKKIGGLGICGRPLCCRSFMTDFVPVSIKMARRQNLSLNPSKVSGHCGRLRCCMAYEHDTYVELAKGMPKSGVTVKIVSEKTIGIVQQVDILRQQVRVLIDDGDEKRIVQVPVTDVQVCHGKNR